ncbi:hypothetical protein GGS23DRAFT_565408 [Durotheca rogersii]|uniref:uncharacterized protein n=1 Tax=Durotheca rogersii TaxID=419775 RepID=UPI002220C608|nr:uncharacterized protein GGS23DRAFT_565408 [Durotheca rogersii]KAI5863795.1 hypothetical protein GGS23DRAFT_565408 [Durotheca rogersii]
MSENIRSSCEQLAGTGLLLCPFSLSGPTHARVVCYPPYVSPTYVTIYRLAYDMKDVGTYACMRKDQLLSVGESGLQMGQRPPVCVSP